MEYLAIKKNKIMPFAATWMDLEITLSEVSQSEKTVIIRYCLYAEPKKNDTNELIYTTETDRQRKQTYGYQRQKMGGRDKLGL